MEKKWLAISITLAVICLCVFMSIPAIKVPYTVKEPYSVTEIDYVTEPYIESAPLAYQIERVGVEMGPPANIQEPERILATLYVEIRNTDDIGGYFNTKWFWGYIQPATYVGVVQVNLVYI